MKFRLLLLALALLFGSTGCAFAGIGAGIGAAVPKTEQPTASEHIEFGDAGDHALVATAEPEKEHAPEVRKRKGNHWLTGFLIGGAIDIVATGALTYFATRSFSGLSAMGGM